jgi:hypothetical protein
MIARNTVKTDRDRSPRINKNGVVSSALPNYGTGRRGFVSPSHGGNGGSNPPGDANDINAIDQTAAVAREAYGICTAKMALVAVRSASHMARKPHRNRPPRVTRNQQRAHADARAFSDAHQQRDFHATECSAGLPGALAGFWDLHPVASAGDFASGPLRSGRAAHARHRPRRNGEMTAEQKPAAVREAARSPPADR